MLPPGGQHSDKGLKETILDDDDCPLQIFRDWPNDKGNKTTKGLEFKDLHMSIRMFAFLK